MFWLTAEVRPPGVPRLLRPALISLSLVLGVTTFSALGAGALGVMFRGVLFVETIPCRSEF